MRVAHFVHAYPERAETFISRQVEGPRARGHEVGVYTHGAPKGHYEEVASHRARPRSDS